MFTLIPKFDEISGNYKGEEVQKVEPKQISGVNLGDIDFEKPINDNNRSDEIFNQPVDKKNLSTDDIDFEEPIKDVDESSTAISQYEEPSVWDRLKTFTSQPLKSLEFYGYNEVSPAKDFHITQLSEHFNVSPSTVEDNYDAYRRAYNPNAEPTFKEKIPQTMQFMIGAGLIHAPIPTLTNVFTFMGLDELINIGVSATKGDVDYKPGGSAGLSEIFEAKGLSSDVLEVAEFITLGWATGKITSRGKSLMGEIAKKLPEDTKYDFINKVAKLVKEKGTSPDKAALEVSKETNISEKTVNEAKAKVIKAEVEAGNIIKSRNKSAPKPKEKVVVKGKDKVFGVTRPDYVFTSKRGNIYEKIGDKWYNEEGVEVNHEWVIKAAEKGKIEVKEPKVKAEEVINEVEKTKPSEIESDIDKITAIEKEYGKPIDQVTDKEIEKFFESKAIEEPTENITEGILYRQTDPKVTKERLEVSRGWDKIDTADGLINRVELEVNSWLDGNDKIKINEIKTFIDDLSKALDNFANGIETPKGIFSDIPLSEIVNLNEHVKGLNKWVQKAKRVNKGISPNQPRETLDKMLEEEGLSGKGTKLYSVGGAIGEGIGKAFDRLIGKDKVKHLQPEYPDFINSAEGKARENVRQRRSELDLQYYRTNKFIDDIMQKTNQKQREAVLFDIEKTDVPEALNRPDIEKILKNDKKLISGISKDVKEHFNEGFKRIKKELPDMSARQIENYVTHIWDIPKNKRAEAINWFSTQNRFLERRFIDTYKEGIERGYKPKTLDITEIIKTHDNVANRAIANKRFIDSIMKMNKDGVQLLMRTNKPPENYIEVDYSPLKRFVPGTKSTKGKGKGFVKEAKIYAHPDIVRPLKTVFEERFDHPIISSYEAVNGVMKKGLLTASLFHPGALAEVGIALGISKETLDLYFNPKTIFDGIVKGKYEIFKNQPLAEDAIYNGNVQFGATSDIPVNKIQSMLDNLAYNSKDTPIANKVTKLASSINKAWDSALWNYLHDTLKLLGYESLVSKMDPNLSLHETKLAKREIGQFINDTFGGQKWDLLNVTPKEIQMMTWSLLSADWTVSTTRQALAAGGIGRIYNETAGLRKSMGRKFWLRAGIYFGVGVNALNVAMREKDMRENPQYYQDKEYTLWDKTMWGNSPGKKTYLFMGRYDDGSERYTRWGKQFRDFFELTIDPLYSLDGRKALKKLGGKAAPGLQTIVETFTGHTMSGYKNDDIYGAEGLEGTLNIFKNLGSNFMPISLRRYFNEDIEFKKLDIIMQSTKGMTRYNAMKYFKKALVENDEQMLKEIYVSTLRNNLPAYTLFNQSLAWAKSEITAELTKDLDAIEDTKAKFDVTDNPSEKARYGRLLGRLNKEKADKEQGIKLLNSAIIKARNFQIEVGGNKTDIPSLPSNRSIGKSNRNKDKKKLDGIVFE